MAARPAAKAVVTNDTIITNSDKLTSYYKTTRNYDIMTNAAGPAAKAAATMLLRNTSSKYMGYFLAATLQGFTIVFSGAGGKGRGYVCY